MGGGEDIRVQKGGQDLFGDIGAVDPAAAGKDKGLCRYANGPLRTIRKNGGEPVAFDLDILCRGLEQDLDAQLIGAAACVIYMYRHRAELDFDFSRESFRMDRRLLSTMLRLAAPLAFQTIAINISMLFVNAWINAFGVVASAANGVGSKLNSLTTVLSNAMQSASATFTGQNIAARKTERVQKTLIVSVLCCLAFWVLSVGMCVFLPRQVFGLFTHDADVLDMAPSYMRVQIVMYLTFALMGPPLGFINGVGHVTLNLLIALADGIVARIGLCLLLSSVLDIGPYAYWWANALAGFVSVIWGWLYYFSGRWKTRKLLTEQ